MKRELKEAIHRFEGTPILVVGDLIVDHYIWGTVSRISPEAPVVVVQVKTEDRRPGGAGNVARNLLSLGARVNVCGIVGDDEAGRQVSSMMKELGADVSSVFVDPTRPTTTKSRVIAHAQQVVRIDRETVTPLDGALGDRVADSVAENLSKVRGAVVSDYGKGAVCARLFDRLREAHEKNITGLHRVPVVVDPKLAGFSLYKSATVIKPNRREAEEASGKQIIDRKSALEVARMLLAKWQCEMVMITLGEDGMVLVTENPGEEQAIEIDTVAREVFDVSGAGDTVSAVFTLALASGSSPHVAAELANHAAGIVVSEVGTVAVTREELLDAIG